MLRNNPVTYFGRTNVREPQRTFGIRRHDRLSHLLALGKTGTGKSTLLETMLMQDVAAGEGCALFDVHGDLVDRVYRQIPSWRLDETVYLNMPDHALSYGYNPIARVSVQRRALVASGLLEVFKKIWVDAWGVRMEHVLRNSVLTLLDQPHATLADIPRLLTEKDFQYRAVRNIAHPPVRDFWTKEFAKYSTRYRADAIAPILNKVGAFLSDPRLYRFFTNTERPIRFRSIMDEGKILLVNLSKGLIGEDSATLLGSLLLTSLNLAAFSRADMPAEMRRPFFTHVDEFQVFTTLSMANMAAESRKLAVSMAWFTQTLTVIDPTIRGAIIGNAGTLVSVRLGATDARFVAEEYAPRFCSTDLLNLPNYEMYVKLLIDGAPSLPFSAQSLRPRSLARAVQ